MSFSVSLAKVRSTLVSRRTRARAVHCRAAQFARTWNALCDARVAADTYLSVPLSVVLIEDHQALREGLELLLSREGLEVIGTAGSASEGRELIDRTGPDVALIDIRLGDDSGIDLTRALLDDDRERRGGASTRPPARGPAAHGPGPPPPRP